MTQSIVIQVGQCGNQIGCRFWDLALKEQAAVNKNGIYNESLGTFFRNVHSRRDDDVVGGDGPSKIHRLKARAVLVDMEEGVVSELVNGPLRDLFDSKQLITDVSGSGNNWAVGHKLYGTQYSDKISESLRQASESCDCLQSFFLIHSMGGGTGSGLGTYVLNLLDEEYPDIYRFVTSVYPSAEDDVITSPYNSVLAMRELSNHADCVLPIENQALVDIVNKISQSVPSGGKRTYSSSGQVRASSALTESHSMSTKDEKPFDKMNNIVANLLLNMTSSSRFEGSLNVDLNEISMNLVPFPHMHYLVASQAPLYTLSDVNIPPRRLDQMFADAFSKDNQMMQTDPRHSVYLACALMVRGGVEMSDVRRNIERWRSTLQFVHWNQEGWKTGHCSVPPVGQPYCLLSLANNTCVRHTFTALKDRFTRLYKRKAHMHHYTEVEGMMNEDFSDSLESINHVVQLYEDVERQTGQPVVTVPRIEIAT